MENRTVKKGHTLANSYCKVCQETKLHEFGNYIKEDRNIAAYKQCLKCETETILEGKK